MDTGSVMDAGSVTDTGSVMVTARLGAETARTWSAPDRRRRTYRGLLGAELARCAKRRLLRWLVPAVALVVIGVVAGAMLAGLTYRGPELATTLAACGRVLVPLAAALGAALQGSWFTSGTVSTLALWEPRRVRLLSAQGLAIAATVAGTIAASALCVCLGLAIWSAWSELPVDGASALDSAREVALITAGAAGAALLGAAVATITRSAASAVAIVLVGHLIVEQVVAQLVAAMSKRLILGDLPVSSFVELVAPFGAEQLSVEPAPVPAVVGAGLWLTLVVAVAAWRFARRDLT